MGPLGFLAALVPVLSAAQPAPDALNLPGLISFWDFQEPAGSPRQSKGPSAYALEEGNDPIERAPGGIWGPYSARIKRGQWLRSNHQACPALDLHGPGAQYTVLAWVKRMSDNRWQFIAGMWDEKDARRQYALLVSGSLKTSWRTLKRSPAEHCAHAYASAEGGGTAPQRICLTYATGATTLEKDRWYFLAATYDTKDLRVYVDGEFDTLEDYNPYHYPDKPLFDGRGAGPDFTVGQRAVPGWPEYPAGKFLGVHKELGPLGFDGILGGLAVYNRAVTPEEIRSIHRLTRQAPGGKDVR